jgi:glycosyltransferase involved in cell wall biosynthesis
MKPSVSVIICSHNPREDYLERTLQGLKAQTLPPDQWELLLVDNASEKPLAERWDLSWHPQARHVPEQTLGLTAARLRGVEDSVAELLLFVDDDNILCTDYLQSVLSLSQERPYIGAFGASSIAEFETTPTRYVKNYLRHLAVDELERDCWTNLPMPSKALPFGAGLCVRRSVADAYRQATLKDPLRKRLDRVGKSLASHGDQDLALCAIDLGMGVGRFRDLRLIHLISEQRVSEDYIVRIVSEGTASQLVLFSIRNLELPPPERTWVAMAKLCWRLARANRLERKILLATRRIQMRTRRLMKSELFGGRLSYPLYILHWSVLKVFGNYFFAHHLSGWRLAVGLIIEILSAIAFAYCVMILIDDPLRAFLNRRSRRADKPVRTIEMVPSLE